MMALRVLQLLALIHRASGWKIYAAGSGHDMFSVQETCAEVIAMTGKRAPRVLYLGTATYDDAAAAKAQTQHFTQLGCAVHNLSVSYATPPQSALAEAFANTDVVLVSGGNTLFATDRWKKLGMDAMIRDAGRRGVVLAGGSAGGITWFDGGHSDSMDPNTYKNPPGPLVNPNLTKAELDKSWAYIRAPALGLLPGLFCPHYDVTEGNGELRATSFTTTLRHFSGEQGVAVDNWAALRFEGDTYSVVSRKGKTGSVGPDGKFTTNFTAGHPGAWTMRIDAKDGALLRSLVPSTGRTNDLVRDAAYLAEDSMLPVARRQNPDDGLPPSTGMAAEER